MKIEVAGFQNWKNTFITKWGNFNFAKLPQRKRKGPMGKAKKQRENPAEAGFSSIRQNGADQILSI